MLESAELKLALLAGHGGYFSLLSAALKRHHDITIRRGKCLLYLQVRFPSLRDAKTGTEGKSWRGAVCVCVCMCGSKRLISGLPCSLSFLLEAKSH